MSDAPLTVGHDVVLDIEKPAAGGRMIARAGGRVVLVSGTLPGERVSARIERLGKGIAFARTVVVEQGSPDRREVTGDPACGGCSFAHVAYARQLSLKGQIVADALTRIGRIPWPDPIEVVGSPERGYRMRARLHVYGPLLGFLREGSHQVCPPRQSGQLLDASVDVLERVGAVLAPLGLRAIREVELSENVNASQRVLALDSSEPVPAHALAPLGLPEGTTGLVLVTPRRVQTLAGVPWVTDVLESPGQAPVQVQRHVLSFFQGNRHLLNQFVAQVLADVPHGATLVDLYAGAGVFALAAAAWRGAHVTAVEGDRAGASDLKLNAEVSGGAVTPVHQPVEQYLQSPTSMPDVVIVDPPRTGMSPEAVAGLIRLAPSSIVAVSCDPATFARDARLLVEAGYTLARIQGFDLFPNTPHVETVALLTR